MGYLAQQRYVLRLTAYGLTDDQARAVPGPGPLSIGGLIKHVAFVERQWMRTVLQQRDDKPGGGYERAFGLVGDETLAAALDDYAAAARDTDVIVAGIADLGQAVPVPRGVPWFPDDVDAWSVRWVLLHLIQETARHAGHADLIREAIDGATAISLMAAAEGWPATEWLRPWERTDAEPGTPAPQ
jgi:hypothetical protein